jgi:hypothetical protein
MSISLSPPKMKSFETTNSRNDLSRSGIKQTLVDAGNKSTTKSSFDMKPAFIARKIEDEDLFGDTVRANVLGLSQINEEKINEEDELVNSQVEVSREEEGKDLHTSNIFKLDMLSSSKYKEYNRGPVYREGHIIRHSVVGPLEVFERYQKQLKRNSKDNQNSFDKGDNVSVSESSVMNRTHTFKFQPSMNENSGTSSFLQSMGSNLMGLSAGGGALSKKQ